MDHIAIDLGKRLRWWLWLARWPESYLHSGAMAACTTATKLQ